MKRRDETPEEPSDVETGSLPEKEFRVMIINMIRGVFPASPVVKTILPLQGSIPGQRTRYRLPLHHVVRPKKIKNKEMVKKEKKKKGSKNSEEWMHRMRNCEIRGFYQRI